MAENKYSEGWNRGFHEGYVEGVHDGHEKLLKEINKELLKLTLTSDEKQEIHFRGFQEGWQARQKDVNELEVKYNKACEDLAWYKEMYEVYRQMYEVYEAAEG